MVSELKDMILTLSHLLFAIGIVCRISAQDFPPDFVFGSASAAYQIEGGWNASGKGLSIWDYNLHQKPNLSKDGTNGDVACDSYHDWKDDITMLKILGVNYYRFSLSWSRILPDGTSDYINPDGINYYNNLIDGLLAEGIKPYVTIYHWDLPQALQDHNGFLNRTIIDHYVNFSRIAFKYFGDRVKHWMTFNEPFHTCEYGYNIGIDAPFIKNYGTGGYQCSHHLLLAHAKTYRMYQKDFKKQQGGQIGLVVDSSWFEPKQKIKEDFEASVVALEMYLGYYYNPVVYGNYPKIMIDRVREQSLKENLTKSRLPEFTNEEKNLLKGSFDFLGLNHYTTTQVHFATKEMEPGAWYNKDINVVQEQDPSWPGSSASWLRVVPEGIRKLLVWVKRRYNNPKILITENGYGDFGELDDDKRISYITSYLAEISKAMKDYECNVIGYTVWCLMDNFEWTAGYTVKFGLFQVDFNDPGRKRTPKKSVFVYKKIVATKRLN